jgi:hypothetical protein
LKERIASVSKEREELQARLDAVENQERALTALLIEENARWNGLEPKLPFDGPMSKFTNGHSLKPLGQLLLELLMDRTEWTTEKLARAAVDRKFPFGTKSPNRSVHFGCVGLKNNKLIDQTKGGWMVKENVKIH